MSEESQILDEVKEFVERCLAVAHLEVSCDCDFEEGNVNVRLEGVDSGVILRENARMLYALNHLVNQAFYRKNNREYGYVVDCDDYRGARMMELRLLAKKAAEKVRGESRPFRLQPMPAGERRIIHLALAEEPEVRTESEGSGQYRRVVILPRD